MDRRVLERSAPYRLVSPAAWVKLSAENIQETGESKRQVTGPLLVKHRRGKMRAILVFAAWLLSSSVSPTIKFVALDHGRNSSFCVLLNVQAGAWSESKSRPQNLFHF